MADGTPDDRMKPLELRATHAFQVREAAYNAAHHCDGAAHHAQTQSVRELGFLAATFLRGLGDVLSAFVGPE